MGTTAQNFERNWENLPKCRICAGDVEKNHGVHIFNEDGERHYLQAKIRKYLYILVLSEDKLPKMICYTCIKKLEGIHHFALTAYQAQQKLRSQLDNNSSTDISDSYGIDESEDEDDKGKNSESNGLLHSILSSDLKEMPSDGKFPLSPGLISETNQDKQFTLSMEEMEVKVDPMLFLQCGMDHSASESSEESDIEEKNMQIQYPELTLAPDSDFEKKEPEKKHTNVHILGGRIEAIQNEGSKPNKCTLCSRSFISQIGLQNHLWSHLPQEKSSDEKSNSKSHVFSTNGVLHINVESGTIGMFICPICGKKISTKGNLKVHLETHRPKGKYGCDICGRIFKTQSNLFRHKEYHSGVQFPCNVCGRVYPTNSTLRAHSITHSDLRPHACPLCDKTFKRNQDLKFHINQHTGARPYQCPYCPKAFASSGNCFSHRKRMHPREVHRDRQRAAELMR